MPHRHHAQTHIPTPPPRPQPPHVNADALIIVFAVLATMIVLFMKLVVERQILRWMLARKTDRSYLRFIKEYQPLTNATKGLKNG